MVARYSCHPLIPLSTLPPPDAENSLTYAEDRDILRLTLRKEVGVFKGRKCCADILLKPRTEIVVATSKPTSVNDIHSVRSTRQTVLSPPPATRLSAKLYSAARMHSAHARNSNVLMSSSPRWSVLRHPSTSDPPE
jgi:hypothetical protein